jgi:hypothetical protein
MKVFVNRKLVKGPWGGGNLFVKALYENKKIEVMEYLDSVPDVIFLMSPFPDSNLKFSINEAISIKKSYPSVKIIMRVNDCDARKNTNNVDKIWIESSKFVDKTIFVSKWMKNYFLEKEWHCKNNYILYNGVNQANFTKNKKFENDKINLVTHHWSNNRMKGFDIYESIDKYIETNKNYTFTYIGRELGTFKNTKVINPLFGKELGKELGKYDVYISASRFDPGPNHILESLSCKIPTFSHIDGGGSCEFTGRDFTYSNLDQLIKKITSLDLDTTNTEFTPNSWEDCIKNLNVILDQT